MAGLEARSADLAFATRGRTRAGVRRDFSVNLPTSFRDVLETIATE